MMKRINDQTEHHSKVNPLNRVDHQLAYVLMSQPWKETSLLVEILTRDYGRLSLIARSARRPKSVLRGVLMPFAPLEIAWFGKNELRTLHSAEWCYGIVQLTNIFLWSGFYINELVLRLTARDDPMPEFFDIYDKTMRAFASQYELSTTLRHFELSLLQLFGYSLTLDQDVNGERVVPENYYLCKPKTLPQIVTTYSPNDLVSDGAVLLAISKRDFSSDKACRFARRLTKKWIESLLPNGKLSVREILSGVGMIND
jgi:DNA repair protein RecO (recombination protein O)